MEFTFKKKTEPQAMPDGERRRIAHIVHDDRGNASVSWQDAPADHERPVLEILGEPSLSLQTEEAYDPYARGGMRRVAPRPNLGATRTRTDLRKLSEHIKLMRALEQRKRNGGDAED